MPVLKAAGSPSGEPVYLVIGFLRRPHGLRGELVMDLHTDFPERIKPGRQVFIGSRHEAAAFSEIRPHGKGMLVKLHGYDTPESVGRFRNQWVYIMTKDARPLPKGRRYKYELIGLTVRDENGGALGRLEEILETGANDVYVVRNESGKEILLPAISSVILEVDMDERCMRVHLLEGL